MSERDKSDGLVIGILVVLVLLLMAAGGMFVFGYRTVRVEQDRAIVAEQQARRAAEVARAEAERAAEMRQQAQALETNAPAGSDADPEKQPAADPKPDTDSGQE